MCATTPETLEVVLSCVIVPCFEIALVVGVVDPLRLLTAVEGLLALLGVVVGTATVAARGLNREPPPLLGVPFDGGGGGGGGGSFCSGNNNDDDEDEDDDENEDDS